MTTHSWHNSQLSVLMRSCSTLCPSQYLRWILPTHYTFLYVTMTTRYMCFSMYVVCVATAWSFADNHTNKSKHGCSLAHEITGNTENPPPPPPPPTCTHTHTHTLLWCESVLLQKPALTSFKRGKF